MTTTTFRTRAVYILILAVISTSSNSNKKYVKGEGFKADELCQLGHLISAGKKPAKIVEDLQLTAPSMMPVDNEKGKPWAALVGLERNLLGSGTHRQVHSAVAVELHLEDHESEMSATGDCELLLLETLCNGVFADPFELNRLQQKEAVKNAQIYGDADLERSAKNSFRSVVELRQRLVAEERNGLGVLYRSQVTMPLHARYPQSSIESHSLVNITIPQVLVHCRERDDVNGRDVNSKQELCIYVRFSEPLMKTLPWSIASGHPLHSSWVASLTAISAFVGVAAIFISSELSSDKNMLKSFSAQSSK